MLRIFLPLHDDSCIQVVTISDESCYLKNTLENGLSKKIDSFVTLLTLGNVKFCSVEHSLESSGERSAEMFR